MLRVTACLLVLVAAPAALAEVVIQLEDGIGITFQGKEISHLSKHTFTDTVKADYANIIPPFTLDIPEIGKPACKVVGKLEDHSGQTQQPLITFNFRKTTNYLKPCGSTLTYGLEVVCDGPSAEGDYNENAPVPINNG